MPLCDFEFTTNLLITLTAILLVIITHIKIVNQTQERIAVIAAIKYAYIKHLCLTWGAI